MVCSESGCLTKLILCYKLNLRAVSFYNGTAFFRMISQRTLLFIPAMLVSSLLYAQSPVLLLRQMIDSAKVLQGFRAEITKEERINGKLIKQISFANLRKDPYSLYLIQQYPKEGVEVLVRSMDDKPLVNPNSFPWFNINLDPYGQLMRKNQHHTVFDSGFDLLMNTLDQELIAMEDNKANISFNGMVEWEGRPAYEIEVFYPDYGKSLYRVMMGEDLNSIAKKLNISEYSILELNKQVDFYDDVDPGDEITIPSSYAKKMVLIIDSEYMLPMVTRVFDDKGLYEQYSYRKFIHNPTFDPGEFKSDYNDYGF